MAIGKLTWQQAAIEVLKTEGKPLRTTDVGALIAERQLTASVGAAPTQQASVALRTLLKTGEIRQVGKLYALPEIADQAIKAAAAEADADYEASTDENRLTVKAYGLYWSRNFVDWSLANGRLLGRSTVATETVDFADRDGIYLLHNGNEVAYVGKSYTPASTAQHGLYRRLKDHNEHHRRTDRWDTFSWFGFGPVDPEDGRLLPAPGNATLSDVINRVEAILIEGLMPRLNMRAGEDSKEWLEPSQYFQVEDPNLFIRRLNALAIISQATQQPGDALEGV